MSAHPNRGTQRAYLPPPSLVVLQQEFRVDRLEAETPADVLVELLHQRTKHHAFPLGFRVQHARSLGEDDELVESSRVQAEMAWPVIHGRQAGLGPSPLKHSN